MLDVNMRLEVVSMSLKIEIYHLAYVALDEIYDDMKHIKSLNCPMNAGYHHLVTRVLCGEREADVLNRILYKHIHHDQERLAGCVPIHLNHGQAMMEHNSDYFQLYSFLFAIGHNNENCKMARVLLTNHSYISFDQNYSHIDGRLMLHENIEHDLCNRENNILPVDWDVHLWVQILDRNKRTFSLSILLYIHFTIKSPIIQIISLFIRKNNRQYIGFELNADYIDIANKRIKVATEEKKFIDSQITVEQVQEQLEQMAIDELVNGETDDKI